MSKKSGKKQGKKNSPISEDESILKAIEEYEANPTGFDLMLFCFKEQFKFISDPSPFKVAVCSRRSGKTVACAAHLIHEAIHKEGRVVLYITLSRLNAKRIIWSEITSINQRFGLGGVPNETELSMYFPVTNSTLYLSGAKDKSEIEKFRGLAISLCYIDECQSFRSYIRELIDDVIGAALMDYAGTLCLIGTPGPIPAGYFYECAEKSETWSKHAWTFWQNPFIQEKSGKTHQELLERELKRRGVSVDDPSIQREWFGRWVLDSDSLLIHYDKTINHFIDKDPGHYHYLLGIDIGFEDADALAVLAWCDRSKDIYLVEEVVTHKQGLTELVEQIQKLQITYDFDKMIMDEGGLGKKMAEEMRRRHHLPIHPADKMRKMENIAFLNDALRTGRFKAKEDSRFAQDSFLVEIDYDRSTPDKIRVKDSYHSDIIDAVLYAFRESPAWTYVAPIERPKYGTAAWAHQEVTEMERAAEEHFTALEQAEEGYGIG